MGSPSRTTAIAYRETNLIRSRRASTRAAILQAARQRIAAGGYQAAQMQIVAADAGVATGTIYRHFPSKAELFATVFQRVAGQEVDAVAAAAGGPDSAAIRLQRVAETFIQRALAAPRLAYALLAEPVDPLVEAERLVFRRTYAAILADLVGDGIRQAAFPPQSPDLSATALVGMLAETLVGPLSPQAADPPALPVNEFTQQTVALCLRAVSARSHP
ncbi:TetR/AcrR family transcriptional regulator [Salinisphaera sp. P385]|uniref:TetR/AcrR family transcriptional regulator n=1 Tax=Spectribacter acetivorans TaxID=3075603 RepID=A0ABU3BDF2_9GAMM|nr:TetR/AcrR family transcriptional regulator [Salinisphaera sp. P385]MDT0619318.1 TetR/AcrR family transcriptional regulator [Salinisphaera sp. P385]